MTLVDRAIAVGITGPFGAGSTTASGYLSSDLGYSCVRLSDFIAQEWKKRNGDREHTRADFQQLGNDMRKKAGNPGLLADLAVDHTEASNNQIHYVVLDGIRNVGEIEVLRARFGHRFCLLALECPASERFGRLSSLYGTADGAIDKFSEDNENDRDQEHAFGQQVAICVDRADVLLVNDNSVTLTALRDKLKEYVSVVTGDAPRYPNALEILMNFAYSAAHGSKCLKRQVGATIVTAPPGRMGEIVGQGFNENPRSTAPCIEEPKYGADLERQVSGRCYRDIVRSESFNDLMRQKAKCPKCGSTIQEQGQAPPWRCDSCHVDLEKYFWPERAMTQCTAIHAEVAALLSAGHRARGATLYTTTYPCFQCAEKIAHAGIHAIVFTEPYPDVRAAERLEIARIDTLRFEGVRSGRFDEIFSRARPYFSDQREAGKRRE